MKVNHDTFNHLQSFAKGRFVKEPTFSQQLNECRKSLEAFMSESEQTLALMLIAKKFPHDAERKAALELQCHREDRLLQGYQSRRSELLRQVVRAKNQTGADTPTPELDSSPMH